MAHAHHDHDDHHIEINKRLIIGITANTLFMLAELVIALVIGSLALLSDAGHNFADSFALVLALFALYQSKKLPTERKTFGFFRTGVLAALFNSTVLIVITLYIFYEAYLRILNPPAIPGNVLIVVAFAGLVINGVIAFGFRNQKDINLRAAFLHLFADALTSLSVLIAGVIITVTGFNLIDPIISIIIGIFILYSTWGVTKEAIDILMEATPKGMNVDNLINDMLKVKEVKNVHHLHVWEIGAGVAALSCHVVIEDMEISKAGEIISQLELLLAEDHGIVHPTIQVETQVCQNGICQLPHV